jgi:hypothetical protein
MICYYKSFGYIDTMLSNIVANDLTHVSVPAEDGLNMSLRGPTLSCPLMPLADQHLRAHSCSSWTSTFIPTSSPTSYSQTIKITPSKRKAYTSIIVLLKAQTKNNAINNKIRPTLQKITTYLCRPKIVEAYMNK